MTDRDRRYDHPGYIVRQGMTLEKAPIRRTPPVVATAPAQEPAIPSDASDARGGESAKIFHLVAPYARGKGLDVGCRASPCLPHMIGIALGQATAVAAGDLRMFDDASLDFIFSSHLLQRIEPKQVLGVLKKWARKLKQGGHLIFYLPNADDSREGATASDRDRRWDIHSGDIERLLNKMPDICGWQQLECEIRSGAGEHSLFEVYRKSSGPSFKTLWQRNPGGKKRCLVARWGAIGDCLVAGSVLRGLHEQGYHVTLNTSPLGEALLANSPYVDAYLVFDGGTLTQDQYDRYFRRIAERYDKVVNLDSTLEGLMLTHDGLSSFYYPPEARRFIFDKNYQELAHHVAGVPLAPQDAFFPTASENEWAAGGRAFMAHSELCVVWAISGSAIHKVYPWINVVAAWLAKAKVHVVFTGGADASQELEKGILQTLMEDGADPSYIHPCVGQWTIRESIVFAQHADCVVGPETGLMHGVAMTAVAKVVYLSHSSPENLTKYWVNATTLTPDPDRCPCYPCHQIHDWWDTCTKDEAQQVARCAASIAPEAVFEAIMAALRRPRS
jgi:ADP-heptose:LPS heptosyltransferase